MGAKRYELLLLSFGVMCFLSWTCFQAVSSQHLSETGRTSKCEKITIPMCQDMPYNFTRMPNVMGHMDQSDAAIQVHEFLPLVEIGCSVHLKFFLCSLYAPMCSETVDLPIPSCQSICEEVKSKCLPVLQGFHFNWPPMLDCSRLPDPEKNGLCMAFPNITSTESSIANRDNRAKAGDSDKSKRAKLFAGKLNFPGIESNFPNNVLTAENKNKVSLFFGGRANDHDTSLSHTTISPWSWDDQKPPECTRNFVAVPVRYPNEHVCAPRCDKDVYFTRDDKASVQIWMGTFAAVCFVATLFTVCTFFIDTARFRYPERPIIFLSMCSCLSSVAYLLRVFLGPDAFSCDRTDVKNPHLVVEGLDSSGCVIVFLLLYFFGTASSVWWVILTITWYLAACRKWGHEAIESKSSFFHVAAWALPASTTVALWILRYIQADELTGLCYVGSQNDALLTFVIAPNGVLFVLGCVFLILGLVSLVRIRQVMKHVGRNIDKLERLMVRIGIFSVLYTVPWACLIACYWYEHSGWPAWRSAAISRTSHCRTKDTCILTSSIPSHEIFIVKIVMSQLLGITTGVWVWSSKTWKSWGKFFSGLKSHRTVKSPGILYHPAAQKLPQRKEIPSQVTRV